MSSIEFENPLVFPAAPSKHRGFNILYGVFFALGGLIILVGLALNFLESPAGVVFSSLTALLPLGALILFYRWLDDYEPEPARNLLFAFGWGAGVSTGFALLFNTIGFVIFGETFTLSILAPIVEETLKASFLLLVFFWKRGELDGVVDGIVYAGFIAAGFAFVENILYFTNSYIGIESPTGEDIGLSGFTGILVTFILRGFMSPFAHPFFTSFTGIAIGYAAVTRSPGLRLTLPFIGLGCAIFFHGLWNGSTLFAGGAGFLLVYFFFMIPVFVGYIIFAIVQKKKLAEKLWHALNHAATLGLLPAQDVAWLTAPHLRKGALNAAKTISHQNYLQVKAYQETAVRLGFLHYKVLQGVAPKDYSWRGQDLLTTMRTLRPQLQFANPPRELSPHHDYR